MTSFLLLFFIISLVIAINALETFVASLADVSKNFIPYWAANSFPCSVDTFLSLSLSHLFPTNILYTFLEAFFSISINHEFNSLKDSKSVISYTNRIPCAPL